MERWENDRTSDTARSHQSEWRDETDKTGNHSSIAGCTLQAQHLREMTVGNFTNNRYGAQLEIKYRTNNGRWELGGTAGSTGFSAITREDGWYIGRKQRINASLNASYYEPRLNLQFDLKAGRYIYGDYGVRGDCTRHFGEYAIGLYALCTDGEINGGFHFAIPLPGKME